MKIILQRVTHASVTVDSQIMGEIQHGLLILLGIGKEDTEEDIEFLCSKLIHMRIFNDTEGKMNLSLIDINGSCLVISQFTLFASTKKGNRPSFTDAASPDIANQFYEKFCSRLSILCSKKVEKGVFGADMKVSLLNDGPVTIALDSKIRK